MEYLEILKDTFLTDDRYMYIVNGVIFSIGITLFSAILGIILGLLLAIMKLSHWYPFKRIKALENFNPLSKIAYIYIDVIRGTPVVVQLLIIYFVVFSTIRVDKVVAAVLTFGINSGAYQAEIFRAGIQSIPRGQFEAGRSLGFSYRQTMTTIIMPQAIKNILPTLANEFISLLKETSIAGYIALEDLTKAGDIIRSRTYSAFMPLIGVALIYLILVLLLSTAAKALERRLKRGER